MPTPGDEVIGGIDLSVEPTRAYSLLTIKAIDGDRHIIEGIASTPETDRMGDIVEPLGAQFKLPMPLLWQHDSRQPIGEVFFAKPTKAGIPFKAKIASTDEPGRLKDRLDEAWQTIKLGLVKAVSIGFRGLEHSVMETGGWRFSSWEWLETSLVTIPANAGATIQTVKSISAEQLAASGTALPVVPPGVTGKTVKAKEAKRMSKAMTTAEKIAAFTATRKEKADRMVELMSSKEGETLDASEAEEYEDTKVEVEKLDAHLVRLKEIEQLNRSEATPVPVVTTVQEGSEARAGRRDPVVTMRSMAPKGTGFIRLMCARYQSDVEKVPAWQICRKYPHWHNTPEVEQILRTAVTVGTTTGTTWAEPLVQAVNLASEFAELLHASSIISRIAGIRRVPFNIKVPRQTAGASVTWVGEGKVKPVSALAFDQVTLAHTKVAGIVPITEELMRFSSPAAEEVIRVDLAAAITALVDKDFLDPTKTLMTGVSPASITNGITPITATGITADAFRTDLGSMLAEFSADNMDLGNLVLIMTQTQAVRLSLMVNTMGQPEFPGLTATGGTIAGIPVITSENIVSTGGSPTDGYYIFAIAPRDILLADDGGVTIDVSREASLQMDSTPDSPATASTVLVSLWQHNMVGIRAERFINWVKRRTEAVQFIQNAKYSTV